MASVYGKELHGRPTASGETYNRFAKTAAHKTIPFGTRVRVTNVDNGRSVVVTVNDRGPFVEGRDIDLSSLAAEELGISGLAPVTLEVLDRDAHYVHAVRDAAADGPFTVQVASFKDKDNALRLKAVLERGYKDVYLSFATVKGADVFRVCIGRYENRAVAGVTAKKLADEGYAATIVTYPRQL